MSEPGAPHPSLYGPSWAAAVAASRGLTVADGDGERLAEAVAPVLERFMAIAQELSADEDMYEFRRLLAQEGQRD